MSDFMSYGLKPEILRAIEKLGFVTPTPIQMEAIPYLLTSTTDLIGQAQTGTGKTAAFGLPIINNTDMTQKSIQTLILCPTRELCIQITRDLQSFSEFIKGFKVTSVYGGANMDTQIRELKKKPHIVVGTPGRVLDMIKRKNLVISNVRWLVLDEADEMLSMGFKDELDSILENTPEEKQTLLFSATMPPEIKRIIGTYMNEPQEIKVGKVNKGADNVAHYYYLVSAKDRFEALKRIADVNPDIYGIVFCRTRTETKEVAEKLIEQKYNADALHGDLSQFMRDQVMNRFRSKHLQILVATDVAARGLDVDDLTHIINYNLPDDLDVYIHRSGRTGRAGKTGVSLTIVHSREVHKVRHMEAKVGKPILRKMVPDGQEICEQQLFHLIDKIEKVEVNESRIAKYLPGIMEKLQRIDKEELIKQFVSIEFNYFLSKYQNARDLNLISDRSERSSRSREGRKLPSVEGIEFASVRINIGSDSGMKPGMVLDLINAQLKRKNVEIGRIEIRKDYTNVEIDRRFEKELLAAFQKSKFKGNVKGSSRDFSDRPDWRSEKPRRRKGPSENGLPAKPRTGQDRKKNPKKRHD